MCFRIQIGRKKKGTLAHVVNGHIGIIPEKIT